MADSKRKSLFSAASQVQAAQPATASAWPEAVIEDCSLVMRNDGGKGNAVFVHATKDYNTDEGLVRIHAAGVINGPTASEVAIAASFNNIPKHAEKVTIAFNAEYNLPFEAVIAACEAGDGDALSEALEGSDFFVSLAQTDDGPRLTISPKWQEGFRSHNGFARGAAWTEDVVGTDDKGNKQVLTQHHEHTFSRARGRTRSENTPTATSGTPNTGNEEVPF